MKKLMVSAVVVLGLLGVGCTSTLQDLEGVDATPPDSYEVFQSPDLFPKRGKGLRGRCSICYNHSRLPAGNSCTRMGQQVS